MLFTKKSCHRRSSSTGSAATHQRKSSGRSSKTRVPSSPGPCGGPQLDDDSGDDDDVSDVPTLKKSCRKDSKSATAKSRRKRSVSIAGLDKDGTTLPSPKRTSDGCDPSTPSKNSVFFSSQQKESFTQYRSRSHAISDMDTTSESGSTDSLMSGSESTREGSSDSGDEKGSHHRYSKRGTCFTLTSFKRIRK